MDIQLPDIDGVETLRRLREDERTAAIPVLALTAQAMHGDRERFLAAGFDDYLSKPVNVVELVGAVAAPLRRDGSMRAATPGSSWSTTSPRTCACSRRSSRPAATTSSRPATAKPRSSCVSAKPDLVLLDVVMPGLDGYTVCRRLREREETAMLPVIMLTASDGPEKTQAIEVGADDFIAKPFNQRRAVRAGPVPAPDQALPRHDHRAEPNARGARANAGGAAGAVAAVAAVPVAAARRSDRVVGGRVDPAEPPPAGRDALRRSPRLDELRRRGRAGGIDAGPRRVPRDDRPPRADASMRPSAFSRATASSSSSTTRSRFPMPPCGRCGSDARFGRR